MTTTPIWQATAADHELAEGVLWDERRGLLHWVDILRGTVHSGFLHADGDRIGIEPARRREVDLTVGAVALTERDDTLLVAGVEDLRLLPERGEPAALARILRPDGRFRLNDATADPSGRLLVGTAARSGPHEGGALYRWEAGGEPVRVRDDVNLSNGLAFSPDGSVLYHVDSQRHRVDRADYDPATGTPSGWRRLLAIEGGHQPDGLTVDAEGCLWLAVWGAGEVRRYTPAGVLLRRIDVPAPKVSCVVFAGDDLRTLVISTARAGLAPDDLARSPGSGALFTVRTDAPGLPAHRVRLGGQIPPTTGTHSGCRSSVWNRA